MHLSKDGRWHREEGGSSRYPEEGGKLIRSFRKTVTLSMPPKLEQFINLYKYRFVD